MTSDHLEWVNPKKIINHLGFTPLKSLGQNFLIEKNTLEFINLKSEISKEDIILEIGPGTGALTHFLSQHNTPLLCIEYDKGLAQYLTHYFSKKEHVKIVHSDILESKNSLTSQVYDFTEIYSKRPLKIISNLPYKILTPFLWILFCSFQKWEKCIFLVQKEFADKVTSIPKSKHYSPLSIFSHLFYDVKELKTVGPKQFWPAPEVNSAIISCSQKKNRPTIPEGFNHFLKNIFSQRRKSMMKLLKKDYDQNILMKAFELSRALPISRAEELSPEQLLEFYHALSH